MNLRRKKNFRAVLAALCLLSLAGCGGDGQNTTHPSQTDSQPHSQSQADTNLNIQSQAAPNSRTDSESQAEPAHSLINPAGTTVQERILPPESYSRTPAETGSLTEFLRSYALKEDGSPVLLYDGRQKGNQSAHQAVLTLPLEERDLQQCADSVMRVYAEYYYRTGQPERIAFHFTNGFLAEYTRWRAGERISVNGNQVRWVSGGSYDDSYENFVKYMRTVFCYAGTLSMTTECSEIALSQADVGDVFLKGGSPGHVVMIVDSCENESGRRAFLLAQGYMPAQEFHILKNPLHDGDCWYYEEEITYPFRTPEYVFDEHSLCRPDY